MIPGIESLACGPLAVPDDVMAHVVHVESSRNPFAIGVVGGRLLRQPRNLGEAVATVRMLEARGYNYSIGLAQVNRVNFARFGLDTPESGFDVCNNLAAGAKILAECLQRHEGRWGDAFSCYYSGNARTGYEHGYVQKVFDAMASDAPAEAIGLSPGAASRAERASADAGSTVSPATPWEAVYAARITAPGATRADAVSRVQPLLEASPQAPAAIDAQEAETSTAAMARNRQASVPDPLGGTTIVPATPEARFIAEMQQRASRLEGAGEGAATPVIAAVITPLASTVEAGSEAPAPSVTQEQSNSSRGDAARVF
jgi:type IV secretion system protein VirB1